MFPYDKTRRGNKKTKKCSDSVCVDFQKFMLHGVVSSS